MPPTSCIFGLYDPCMLPPPLPLPLLLLAALLIGTHLFTFLLVPGTMYVFYDKVEQLHADRARSPFVVLLGLSLIMVSFTVCYLLLTEVLLLTVITNIVVVTAVPWWY